MFFRSSPSTPCCGLQLLPGDPQDRARRRLSVVGKHHLTSCFRAQRSTRRSATIIDEETDPGVRSMVEVSDVALPESMQYHVCQAEAERE